MLREEENKKGNFVECLFDLEGYYTKGKVYEISRGGLEGFGDVFIKENDSGFSDSRWSVEHFKLHEPKQDTMYNEHYPNKVDTFTRFKDLAKDTPLDPYEFVCQFNIDKYNLRMGKKEDKVKEINKIINYANEWLKYLECKGENK